MVQRCNTRSSIVVQEVHSCGQTGFPAYKVKLCWLAGWCNIVAPTREPIFVCSRFAANETHPNETCLKGASKCRMGQESLS